MDKRRNSINDLNTYLNTEFDRNEEIRGKTTIAIGDLPDLKSNLERQTQTLLLKGVSEKTWSYYISFAAFLDSALFTPV